MQNKKSDRSYVNDFQTPPHIAKYMVDLLDAGGGVIKTVLEPTPGIGNVVKALKNKGYEVTAPEDYWELDKKHRYDAIVGNPPFSRKTFFNVPKNYTGKGMALSYGVMKTLLQMSDNVILLMPWFTISDSDVRLRQLKKFGLISVTALPRKTFDYARVQTCVLQFQKGYTGPTEFIVYDLIDQDKQTKLL